MINANHIPETSVTEFSLLKRVAIFLEDGEFDRADEYCERVLDMNVENGEAYLYKLMAKLQLNKKEELYDLEEPFDTEPCYAKIMRFGSEELKREVEGINASLVSKKEERQRAILADQALSFIQSDSIPRLTEAYRIFLSLGDRENSSLCEEKIEKLYDASYNGLYLEAKEKEQAISDRQYRNSTDVIEKDDYDQYIKDNQGRKIFDYSLIVAIAVVVMGAAFIFFSASEYLSLAGVSFKTVLRVIFTKIVPGMPLTGIATVLSFRISKKLVKKQKANLIEDIGTAAERAKEIGEKISSAENEAFLLKRELDETLEALRKLNAEYDIFAAEKEKEKEAVSSQ